VQSPEVPTVIRQCNSFFLRSKFQNLLIRNFPIRFVRLERCQHVVTKLAQFEHYTKVIILIGVKACHSLLVLIRIVQSDVMLNLVGMGRHICPRSVQIIRTQGRKFFNYLLIAPTHPTINL